MDPFLAFDGAAAAGIRLTFTTDSSAIALTMRCAALQLGDVKFETAVDLIVDGKLVSRSLVKTVGRVRFEDDPHRPPITTEGPESTISFAGLGDGTKEIELWLPHTATCELIRLDTSRPVYAPRAGRRPIWIHYGSSISHCLETPFPSDTWPARVALDRRVDLINLGFAGQAVLDPFIARTIRDTPADFISLKLGINIVGETPMPERIFQSATEGFIDTIRDGHPDTRLLVTSAIYCPRFEENACEGDLSLVRSRELSAEIVGRRQAEGENIEYLDGRLLLGEGEASDLLDGVHPSPMAYPRMAERFSAHVGF